MEGKEPDACCVPLSQVMQKEIYDSVYYILTKKTHLNTVFHWNLLAYNYLRVIPIYGGRVKGGNIELQYTALQLGIRKSKKNVLFIAILFYPKMALKLMFASIYIGKIEKSIPFQRHPPPSLVKPKQPTTYPLMKMSREKMSRGKFD